MTFVGFRGKSMYESAPTQCPDVKESKVIVKIEVGEELRKRLFEINMRSGKSYDGVLSEFLNESTMVLEYFDEYIEDLEEVKVE